MIFSVQVPLNIDRDPVAEMKQAENEGRFDYDPSASSSAEGAATVSATQSVSSHIHLKNLV